MRSGFTLLAGMAILANAAAGVSPRERPTRAEVFAAPAYDALKFSPDGGQVAMLRPANGIPNIRVAPTSDIAKAVPVTRFTHRGADAFRWVADGRFILVDKDVAGEEDNTIYAADLQRGGIGDLTANPAVQAHILRIAAKLPGKALISLNVRDASYSDVYLIHLASGQCTLALRSDGHYTSFVDDKDLRVRIAGRVNPANGPTTSFDLAGTTPSALFSNTLAALRSARVLGLTDHGTLRMLSGNNSDLAAVVDVDIATGKVTPLAQAKEADVVDLVTDGKTGTVLVTAEDPLVTRWTARSPHVQADLDSLATKLGAGFHIDDETVSGKLWLVRKMSGNGPERFCLWRRDTRSLSLLAWTRPALEQRAMPTRIGKQVTQIADRQWSKTMYDDLLDAVTWAMGRGVTGKDKVAISGLSYGGYSARVGLSFTPDVVRCVVAIAGPANLTALLDEAPDWRAWQRSQFVPRMGDGSTPDGGQDLADRSPITRAAQVRSPLLITHGRNNPRVRPVQSITMAEAVRAHGTPVTLLLYPDEGHVFEKAVTDISFHAIAERFLAQCVGGTARLHDKDLIGSGVQVPMGAQYVPGLEAALVTKAGQ